MREDGSCVRRAHLLVGLLLLVAVLVTPGCGGRSASKYVGTWLDTARTGTHGEVMQAGYILEAGGKGKNVTIQDYSQADAAFRSKIESALSRRMADGRMHQDSAGRYVSEIPCTWSVSGDHIVIDTGLSLGGATKFGAKLSDDGNSLVLGLDQNGNFTPGASGEAGTLWRQ